MNPGYNRARNFKYIKINYLVRVIYLMLNLVHFKIHGEDKNYFK